MVFAVAALILQFVPGTLNVPVAAATQTLARAAEATTATITSTASREAAGPSEPDSSSSAHFKFDRVRLNTGSKESSTPKLSAVSLGSSADSQTLSTVRVPEIQPGKPHEVTMAERRRFTRSWLALSLVQHGAAAFENQVAGPQLIDAVIGRRWFQIRKGFRRAIFSLLKGTFQLFEQFLRGNGAEKPVRAIFDLHRPFFLQRFQRLVSIGHRFPERLRNPVARGC